MLTYYVIHKNLAKSLINPKDEIGKLLLDTYGEIKDCTSELNTNQREENTDPTNQYDNEKCNVGTNFKTGVSIKKDNHAFVIIFPPRSTRLPFRNKYDIFSGGVNSVIQALARQRTKGEIHIVLPKPDHFQYDSLDYSGMTTEQKGVFEQYYNLVQHYKAPDSKVKYIKLNRQDFLLREFYENKLKGNVKDEITAIDSLSRSTTLPRLLFPSFKEFKLETGEDFLANQVPFFGGDISSYVTYSALANQFINCRLQEISFRSVIRFEERRVQEMLNTVLNQFYGEDYALSLAPFTNFSLFYNDFKTSLFKHYQLLYKKAGGDSFENIVEGTTQAKKFELQLLLFTNKLKEGKLKSLHDEDYSRGDYFSDAIAHTKDLDIDSIDDVSYKNRVEFYQTLNYFREKMISSIREHNWGRDFFHYIPTNYYEEFFTDDDKRRVTRLISLLKEDKLLDDSVFEFKRRLYEQRSIKSKLKTFYLMLREDFLIIENRTLDPRITVLGARRTVKPILAVNIIPLKPSINLTQNQDYINL